MRADETKETATLGGGCFWCLESVLANPTYPQVCTGATGHAEVVQIMFDPRVISFVELLDVFFDIHDPTTLNRQGADVGTQYRSAIFSHSPEQKRLAEEKIAALSAAGVWDAPLVTQVVPFTAFFRAEDYHQGYFRNNPTQGYCQTVVSPKLAKFRAHFAAKLKP